MRYVGILTLLSLQIWSPSAQAMDTPQALLEEYRSHLESLEDAHGEMVLIGRFHDKAGNAQRSFEEKNRLEYHRKEGQVLLQVIPYKEDGEVSTRSGKVVYQGPLNTFTLKKQEGSYKLEGWSLDPQKADAERQIFGDYTSCAFQIWGVMVRKMLDSPGFVLKDAKRVTTEKGERVRFDFRYQEDPSEPSYREGWWAVDPNLGWAVCEYEFKGSGIYAQAPLVGIQEFKHSESGSAPALVKVQVSWRPKGHGVERSFEVEECRIGDCPDEPFHISTYGLNLPESSGKP